MSFIQTCIQNAENKQNDIVMEQYKKQQLHIQAYDEKMHEITDKYHESLKNAIFDKSKKGIRELYFNFGYDDFKFNLQFTGNPRKMCNVWLEEMSNPKSLYLIDNETGFSKEHFEGIYWDVWGNGAFTTHFTW